MTSRTRIRRMLEAWETGAVTPGPYSQPHPMLFYGGGSVAAAKRAARLGLHFQPQVGGPELKAVYEEECRAQGREPGYTLLAPTGPANVFCAEDPDRFWAEHGHCLLADAQGYAAWRAADTTSYVRDDSSSVEEMRAAGVYVVHTPDDADREVPRRRDPAGHQPPGLRRPARAAVVGEPAADLRDGDPGGARLTRLRRSSRRSSPTGASGWRRSRTGTAGARPRACPRSVPSNEPDIGARPGGRRWRRTTPGGRRRAVPRVRTPRSATRATGSVTVHQAGDAAIRPGTARSVTPSGVRPPIVRSSDMRGRPDPPGISRPSNGSMRTSSKVYVAAMKSATSWCGASSTPVTRPRVSTIASANGPSGVSVQRPTTTRMPRSSPRRRSGRGTAVEVAPSRRGIVDRPARPDAS